MIQNNTSRHASQTDSRLNYVDYASTIRAVSNPITDFRFDVPIPYLAYMDSKPLLNPIPNMLNWKVTRTYRNQFEEECTPRRPTQNNYPLPEKDVLKQRHIPLITH